MSATGSMLRAAGTSGEALLTRTAPLTMAREQPSSLCEGSMCKPGGKSQFTADHPVGTGIEINVPRGPHYRQKPRPPQLPLVGGQEDGSRGSENCEGPNP